MSFDATTWNYRILRTQTKSPDSAAWETDYSIHEVHYTKKGKPIACTVEPAHPYGETLGEFALDLGQYLAAFTKPVLNLEDIVPLVTPDAS